jgi:acyl-CoA synthetase (AMP-forming)/AMP-acid ligase II
MENEMITSDGWIRTGDIGRFTSRGLTILGRTKDIAIRGAENISLAEIDLILRSLPNVRDAACAAIPARIGGQMIVAVVAPEPGVTISFLDLVAHFRACGVSVHKVPKQLHLAEAVPRTLTGKVMRSNIAAHFASSNPAVAN